MIDERRDLMRQFEAGIEDGRVTDETPTVEGAPTTHTTPSEATLSRQRREPNRLAAASSGSAAPVVADDGRRVDVVHRLQRLVPEEPRPVAGAPRGK
jgi:hypothetical protein